VIESIVPVGLLALGALGLSPMGAQEPAREAIIEAAHDIMAAAVHCALVTLGPDGAPQARMMDPFPPEDDLTVWMATNRDTRKVGQIRADPRVTLIYFDPAGPGYATLVGTVRLVEDAAERRNRWKDAWSGFYPGGPESASLLLLEFVPDRLEVVSVKHAIASEPLAWKPAIVEFERR
jgi:general stress protein 26